MLLYVLILLPVCSLARLFTHDPDPKDYAYLQNSFKELCCRSHCRRNPHFATNRHQELKNLVWSKEVATTKASIFSLPLPPKENTQGQTAQAVINRAKEFYNGRFCQALEVFPEFYCQVFSTKRYNWNPGYKLFCALFPS